MDAEDFGGTCPGPSYAFTTNVKHCCCYNGCCVSGCSETNMTCIENMGPVEWILDDGDNFGQSITRYRLFWQGKSITVADYLY